MSIDPRAGQPADPDSLCDVDRVLAAYDDPPQRPVKFGTSGHRGRSLDGSFQDAHIAATAQAICDWRKAEGITGPIFVGRDTHALSDRAAATVVEVLAANDVPVVLQTDDAYVPTPVISWAILDHNRHADAPRADGIVITPSHNPPEDGGLKYNPPNGGPAGSDVTGAIETRANALLDAPDAIARMPIERAIAAPNVTREDMIGGYVDALGAVIDVEAIRSAGVKIGVDPLGGSAVSVWPRVAERWGLDLEVVNTEVDPAFGFMRLDHDGKIRMDCSSPYAMAGLVEMRDRFDLAIGNDPDADRHGIVTRQGLMNPNHYLALAIDYVIPNRGWRTDGTIGKTLVTSALIDRVAKARERAVYEVPVGFKWFAEPMYQGRCVFAGEESAGASLVRMDGGAWSTDKDGIAIGLLAAEIQARTGENLSDRFDALTERLGRPHYRRVDSPATDAVRDAVGSLSPDEVSIDTLAGDPVQQILSHAPGNDAPIGGIKVVTENGWIAARPSGTEPIVKVYAESFRDEAHLDALVAEGRALVDESGVQATT